MILKELAEILNIDLATTVARFGNNEMLFVRFIKKFPNDKTYSALCEAVENKDYKAIETSAHTLQILVFLKFSLSVTILLLL